MRRTIRMKLLMVAAALGGFAFGGLPGGASAQTGRDLVPQLGAEEGVRYYQRLEQAREAIDAGQWSPAADLLSGLLEATPGHGELWYLLGIARERQGDLEAAAEAFARSLRSGYRNQASGALRIARLLARQGRGVEALEALEESLEHRLGSREGLATDTAFRDLADEPRFRALLPPEPDAEDRDQALRRDLDYLLSEVRRLHAGPGRPAHSPEFESELRDLQSRTPALTDSRWVLEVGRLMTRLNDGHSGLLGPMPGSRLQPGAASLPVSFYAFSDGVFIRDAAPEHEALIGARVLRFGDVPAEVALDSLAGYMHADNAMTPLWLGVHHTLPSTRYLHAIGAADDPGSATLHLRTADGEEVERRLSPEPQPRDFERKLEPPPAPAPTPLYLERVADPYWLRPLPARAALYFQFNQVRNAETGPDLAAFADTLRAALERTGARHLIVDVRHNNGGNNGLLRPLVQTLIWWEQDDPAHRVWVITGRGTFSAAQNFIARVERWTDAVFVGEPSSSSPNFTGETTRVILPYSRLWISVSNRVWQEAGPDDHRAFIPPDLPVGLSSAEYQAGRDPALEAIFLAIEEADRSP